MSGLFSNLKSSLNAKLLWSVAAIFIVFNLGFGLVNGFFSSQSMKKQLTEHYTKVAEARAQVLSEPVWVFEYGRANRLLQELVVNKDILEVKMYIDKETFSASQKNMSTGSTQTVVYPITFKDDAVEQNLGNLTMTFSTQEASSVMMQRITESIILSGLLLLIIAFFTSQMTGKPEETSQA